MSKTVDFYFDYVSPATYFAFYLLRDITKRTGAEINYKPFLLGGVFKETGNTSPMMVPAKGAWLVTDLNRFAKRYQLPFSLNPHFPVKSLSLMRGAIWIQETGDLVAYSDKMFKAVWADQQNVGDVEVLSRLLKELQIDPAAFLEAINRQDIKDKLKQNTDEAVKRGAFGAPTMFVGDQMFWGQDRLDFVEEALAKE